MAVNHSVTDGSIGIDLQTVGSARNYTLGETHMGDGGSCFIYVRASSALSNGRLCVIEQSYDSSHLPGDAVGALEEKMLAFAQTAFPMSTYGFVARAGNLVHVKVATGVGEASQPLYTIAGGELSTATNTASAFQVFNVWLHASVAAANTATPVTAAVSFPFLRKPKAGT